MHELSQISSADRDLSDGVRNSVTLINGHSVSDTLSRVHDSTSCTTHCKQTHNCLVSEVQFWYLKSVEPEMD